MAERRAKSRKSSSGHPLADKAKLRPAGPALDRRADRRPPRGAAQRQRLTVQLPSEVLDQMRDAVYWTPGLTMTGLVEQCMRQMIERLEGDRGSKFPKRKEQLRAGRPPK